MSWRTFWLVQAVLSYWPHWHSLSSTGRAKWQVLPLAIKWDTGPCLRGGKGTWVCCLLIVTGDLCERAPRSTLETGQAAQLASGNPQLTNRLVCVSYLAPRQKAGWEETGVLCEWLTNEKETNWIKHSRKQLVWSVLVLIQSILTEPAVRVWI